VKLSAYDRFCGSLPRAERVIQWGGSHVWKIGGKVFAIGSVEDGALRVSFKVSPMSFDLLKEQAGLRPAPYLASRGMKWIQRTSDASVDDATFRDYLRASYRQVMAGLTKKARMELGLGDEMDLASPRA
jgi:predicted DNA-binding protein (MmcQ/YjbR family)